MIGLFRKPQTQVESAQATVERNVAKARECYARLQAQYADAQRDLGQHRPARHGPHWITTGPILTNGAARLLAKPRCVNHWPPRSILLRMNWRLPSSNLPSSAPRASLKSAAAWTRSLAYPHPSLRSSGNLLRRLSHQTERMMFAQCMNGLNRSRAMFLLWLNTAPRSSMTTRCS